MKTHRLALVCIAVLSSSVSAAPQMSIDQAASLVQQHLKERGLESTRYITSLALEKDSISRGDRYWYARWSESVKLDGQKTELGVRINMDGSFVRIVEAPAAQPKNHRTRSDRPSILDLKH